MDHLSTSHGVATEEARDVNDRAADSRVTCTPVRLSDGALDSLYSLSTWNALQASGEPCRDRSADNASDLESDVHSHEYVPRRRGREDAGSCAMHDDGDDDDDGCDEDDDGDTDADTDSRSCGSSRRGSDSGSPGRFEAAARGSKNTVNSAYLGSEWTGAQWSAPAYAVPSAPCFARKGLQQFVRAFARRHRAEMCHAGEEVVFDETTVSFANLLGTERDGGAAPLLDLRAVEAGGDGSCLFHSFLLATCPRARRMREDPQRLRMGHEFRRELAQDSARDFFGAFVARWGPREGTQGAPLVRACRGGGAVVQSSSQPALTAEEEAAASRTALENAVAWADVGTRSAQEYAEQVADARVYGNLAMVLHLAHRFRYNIFLFTRSRETGVALQPSCTTDYDPSAPSIMLLQTSGGPIARGRAGRAKAGSPGVGDHFQVLCLCERGDESAAPTSAPEEATALADAPLSYTAALAGAVDAPVSAPALVPAPVPVPQLTLLPVPVTASATSPAALSDTAVVPSYCFSDSGAMAAAADARQPDSAVKVSFAAENFSAADLLAAPAAPASEAGERRWTFRHEDAIVQAALRVAATQRDAFFGACSPSAAPAPQAAPQAAPLEEHGASARDFEAPVHVHKRQRSAW